jgi:hypothetical protein
MKKTHTCSFDPTPSLYKISRSNSQERKSNKKDKISGRSKLTNLPEISLFLLYLSYNEFDLEILYIDEVGSKEHV